MSQVDTVRTEGLYVCVKEEESKYLARAVTDPETITPGKLPTLALWFTVLDLLLLSKFNSLIPGILCQYTLRVKEMGLKQRRKGSNCQFQTFSSMWKVAQVMDENVMKRAGLCWKMLYMWMRKLQKMKAVCVAPAWEFASVLLKTQSCCECV